MRRLTGELWAHSAFSGDSDAAETRILDFHLARRSAVVINKIIGQMQCDPDTTSGFDILRGIIQEIDVDPDNLAIEFAGVMQPDGVVLDSSRPFRQVAYGNWDTAAGATASMEQQLVKDWSAMPINERPISITPLRHHVEAIGSISNVYRAECAIDYFIVELDLDELGLLNASRR